MHANLRLPSIAQMTSSWSMDTCAWRHIQVYCEHECDRNLLWCCQHETCCFSLQIDADSTEYIIYPDIEIYHPIHSSFITEGHTCT